MEYINRIGTYSFKWDSLDREFGDSELLAMWVADMDFMPPRCVTKALHAYIEEPLGYFSTPESYYEAIIDWEKRRHDYDIKKEWICVTPGIVPALHWAVRTLTKPGDSIMVSTPVYYPFMNAINHADNRKLVENELKKVENHYEFDFEKFENDIKSNNVKLYILCNPHNPVGRVWTKEELKTILDICKKHQVKVISDEIHQDIINPSLGRKKVTAATVGNYDNMLITMASSSKSFNIAGVQNSFIIIPNEEIRTSFSEFLETMALDDVNGFGHIATEAAFKGGENWLNEILDIIYGNYTYIQKRFKEECTKVKITDLEGTYLVWMDFSEYFSNQSQVKEFLQNKCKLAFDYGAWFGGEQHNAYARMNIATSHENVKTACDRIITELSKY